MNAHDIELPPLPRPQVPRIDTDIDLMDIHRLALWCEKTAKDYAIAAIEADRMNREDFINDDRDQLRAEIVALKGTIADLEADRQAKGFLMGVALSDQEINQLQMQAKVMLGDPTEFHRIARIIEKAAIEADRKRFAELFMDLSRYAAGMYEQDHDPQMEGVSDGYRYAAEFLLGDKDAVEELEADRQKSNALIRYMPEAVAALKATGCNESLVSDIEKSMRGERDRHARGEPKLFGTWWNEEGHRKVAVAADRNGWKGAAEAGYLAGQQARGEPVYLLAETDGVWSETSEAAFLWWRANSPRPSRVLYTAPQHQQIPEGYALVPIEPTEEMKDAADFRSERYGHIATNKYKAMIKAAPQPKGVNHDQNN